MTNLELIQYVEQRLDTQTDTVFVRPVILAVSTLALADLARILIDTDSELSGKLVVTLSNQTWANSSFAIPSNMLLHKQLETTKMYFGTTPAYQLKDRDKIDLSSTLGNIYYALYGKTFYIKHTSTTSGNDLNISYYKIPTLADIDEELRNLFIDLVIARLTPSSKQPENNVRQK